MLARIINFRCLLDSWWVQQMWEMDSQWYCWLERNQNNFMVAEIHRSCKEASNDMAFPFCWRKTVYLNYTSWGWRIPC